MGRNITIVKYKATVLESVAIIQCLPVQRNICLEAPLYSKASPFRYQLTFYSASFSKNDKAFWDLQKCRYMFTIEGIVAGVYGATLQ